MRKIVTLREALSEPGLLAHAMPGESWANWRILLIAAVGEALTEAERVTFEALTGRDAEPGTMVDTWLTVAGRRSGKSRAMAVLIVYLATLVDWSDELSFERGLALIVAPSERQATNILRYAVGIVEASPRLAGLIENQTQDCLTLSRGVDIEVQSANWRRVRGSSCVGVCVDESAFLYTADDAANSDRELLIALKPSLLTTGGPMLITSSPSAMEGVTYQLHQRHHGAKGDPRVLVVQTDSRTLNPKLPQEAIDRAYADDPVAAESEFGGRFRELSSAYLPRPVVLAAVDEQVTGRYVLPGIEYYGHVDPAGGTGRDSMTLAVGHKVLDPQGRELAVIDALAEAAPVFVTDEIVERFSNICKLWGVHELTSDHYSAGWVVSAFARHGITVLHNSVTTSDCYVNVVPLFMSKRVRLLNHQKAIDQLCGLRRKIGQAGREIVGHTSNSHDDLAAAICALLWRLSPGAMSSADHWCDSLVRQAGRGGTDYDDISAAAGSAPNWGYDFTAAAEPAPLVRVNVPPQIGGSVYTSGRSYVCRFEGGSAYVEVDARTARHLLSGPASPWHDLNSSLIEQLSAEHEA